MDYIYDIVLNFQNDYYEFYEWKSTDKIINIKKIPVYITNDSTYLDLKYNDIIIDLETFAKPIKIFLITNGKEVMGLMIDNSGKIIKKSSLLIDEADEVLEEKDTIKTISIKYKQNISKTHVQRSRVNIEKLKFLENYLYNLDINKDEYLLKYIYYDIYNKEENDVIQIYKELKLLMNNDISKLYNSIKKVNLELNT